MSRLLVAAIGVYSRWISPLTPPTCRFHPSCSSYAAQSLQTHGLTRGGWLAVRRLLRCHPWTAGGFDPVPDSRPCRPCRSSPLAGQPTLTSTTSA